MGELLAQCRFTPSLGLDQDARNASFSSGEVLHDRERGGGDRTISQGTNLATGNGGVEREMPGMGAGQNRDGVAGLGADRVSRGFGQDQQPSHGAFGCPLKTQGERAAEVRDLFGGAEERERSAALRSDGDDRLLEQGRRGLHVGHVFDFS